MQKMVLGLIPEKVELETKKLAKNTRKDKNFPPLRFYKTVATCSNVHTPFATYVFPRRCLAWVDKESMTTTFDIDEARGRWPSDASELPADAQAAFAVWSQAPATARFRIQKPSPRHESVCFPRITCLLPKDCMLSSHGADV